MNNNAIHKATTNGAPTCDDAAVPTVAETPAVGTAAAVGAGIGTAVWGALATAPGLVGFGSGGITAGSWAAAWMSSAAVANGGGVAAGSMVAMAQSIGAAGLAVTTGPAIVGVSAAVGVGCACWAAGKSAGGASSNTRSFWGSPVVRGVIDKIVRVAGGAVWVVCWMVDNALRYCVFSSEEEARKAYDKDPSSCKALFDPDQKVVAETKKATELLVQSGYPYYPWYSQEKKEKKGLAWILREQVAGADGGEMLLRVFDDEGLAREAFSDSTASSKELMDFACNTLLKHPETL